MQASSSSTLTLGSALNGFFNEVDQTAKNVINDAKNAAIDVEIMAAHEVELLIESTADLYQKSMEKTVEKLDKATKKAFDDVITVTGKFQAQKADEMADIAKEAQQIANTLPFAAKQTQVKDIEPHNLVIDDLAKKSLITIKGNFPSASLKNCTPTLKAKSTDESFPLVNSTTQALTFAVPNSTFSRNEKELFSLTTLTLNAPWDNSGYVLKDKVDATYRIGIGALPQLAGKGTVEYARSETVRETEHKTEQKFFDGGQWYHQGHYHTEYWKIEPPSGWLIDVTTPKLTAIHDINEHGIHNQGIKVISAKEITVEVTLDVEDGHDMGKIVLKVDYDVIKDHSEERKRIENFELNWSDSLLLEPQGNEVIKRVTFNDTYKNSHQEFGAPDLNSGIFKVASQGNGSWKVWAEVPHELSLKSTEVPESLHKEFAEMQRLVTKFQQISNLPPELRVPMGFHFRKDQSQEKVNGSTPVQENSQEKTNDNTPVQVENGQEVNSSTPVQTENSQQKTDDGSTQVKIENTLEETVGNTQVKTENSQDKVENNNNQN